MRIVADENIEAEIIEKLRANGYEVYAVREQQAGISDEEVLAEANKGDSLLLTSDTDFGELVYRLKYVTSGILLLRLQDMPAGEKAVLLLKVLTEHGSELPNTFTVIIANSIRIRKIE